MKTLILNGSPKGEAASSNTRRLIKYFTAKMNGDYEIAYVYKQQPEILAKEIERFDRILIVMPLYIHAMPSGVMALFEQLSASRRQDQAIGFIIQAGFPESAHEKDICTYLGLLAKRLNYRYLGTVVKGNAAFIYRHPDAYKKLYEQFAALGKYFSETGTFDETIKAQLAMPYQFPKWTMRLLRIFSKLGMIDSDWKAILRENHALDHALDQPFK